MCLLSLSLRCYYGNNPAQFMHPEMVINMINPSSTQLSSCRTTLPTFTRQKENCHILKLRFTALSPPSPFGLVAHQFRISTVHLFSFSPKREDIMVPPRAHGDLTVLLMSCTTVSARLVRPVGALRRPLSSFWHNTATLTSCNTKMSKC